MLARWRGETTALLFPVVLVVLRVSHDFQDKHLLAWIKNASYQAKLVAPNVKYNAVPDLVGVSEVTLDVSPILPRHVFVVDMRKPSSKRTLGHRLRWLLPKLTEPGLGDYPHCLPLLSAWQVILVRKMRTDKARISQNANFFG